MVDRSRVTLPGPMKWSVLFWVEGEGGVCVWGGGVCARAQRISSQLWDVETSPAGMWHDMTLDEGI